MDKTDSQIARELALVVHGGDPTRLERAYEAYQMLSRSAASTVTYRNSTANIQGGIPPEQGPGIHGHHRERLGRVRGFRQTQSRRSRRARSPDRLRNRDRRLRNLGMPEDLRRHHRRAGEPGIPHGSPDRRRPGSPPGPGTAPLEGNWKPPRILQEPGGRRRPCYLRTGDGRQRRWHPVRTIQPEPRTAHQMGRNRTCHSHAVRGVKR